MLRWKCTHLLARHALRFIANRYRFPDVTRLLDQMGRFGQPSEVGAPIELLRAGAAFHARGLLNTKAIQFNRDWIWPYWVERQFNPRDHSFVPRSFSFSHVNLTHRNWTAVGIPGLDAYPIVDPRGLVTPYFDGWSIDAWIVSDDGPRLIPSRTHHVRQYLDIDEGGRVHTEINEHGLHLVSDAEVLSGGEGPFCHVKYRAGGANGHHLAVALRPFNPEGVSLIHSIELDRDNSAWRVNGREAVRLSHAPARHVVANYLDGDVTHRIREDDAGSIQCPVGMAAGRGRRSIHRC